MPRIQYQKLLKVSSALSQKFLHAKIQKIRDPDAYTLCFKLRIPQYTYYLTLSAHPDYPRVTLSMKQPSTLPEPTGVGRWARSHLNLARITGFSVAEQDRIFFMHTTGGSICLELVPKITNLYALTHENIVQAWIEKKTARTLQLGQVWTPIKKQTNMNLTPSETAIATSTSLSKTHIDYSDTIRELLDNECQAQEQIQNIQKQKEQKQVTSILKNTHKRLTRLSTALWKDMEKADQAEHWKKYGELLKNHLHDLSRGMTYVHVTDWYQDGLPQIEITLNPMLNGIENMETYFKKHRKAIKGAQLAAEKLEMVERQLMVVEQLQSQQDEHSVLEVHSELQRLGVFRAKQKQVRSQKKKHKRKPYRVFWSKEGEEIWVGRGGVDNHATTFQHARGQDHWLHTRNVPGAHVIIPLKYRGHQPHFESIHDAAALAVHHSKLRGEEGVDVYHTERKHVRPIPQGPAGRVMVASSKSVIPLNAAQRVMRLYAEAQRRDALVSKS
jgi:predicted ribosome quality control (RQC) complex YloA/Tae2 family protein